jgi:hypothetical protein
MIIWCKKRYPSCDDLFASKGHIHRMLLTYPMASDPFGTMQKKNFFHVIPSHYLCKIEFAYMF